ncbi:hypothetical protein AB0K34_18185 [Actinomadura sp. NPDC049382]|uniref:LmrA/YxaF family transcription factor n=1 Tax=Actinomadura sp. NPDC049382 TaxID=3158220 RepID=UPI003449B081
MLFCNLGSRVPCALRPAGSARAIGEGLPPPRGRACADVFAGWRAATARRFAAEGLESPDDLATFVFAAFEGALILSRTGHDTGPLHVTAGIVAETIRQRSRKAR